MAEVALLLEQVTNAPVGPFTVGEVLPVPPLVALVLWETEMGHAEVLTGSAWAAAALFSMAAIALLWRRRYPLRVLVFIALIGQVQFLFLGAAHLSAGLLCLAIAVFACGAHGDRPLAYVGMLIGVGLLTLGSLSDDPSAFADSWAWGLNMVWVFGLGALVRREKLLGERARDAMTTRAAAASAEERLRLARDLHDVLAHSLAVMIVQAEAADEIFSSDSERAHQALARVQETGRSALGDIRGLLGTLRQTDDLPRVSPPTPGLADVAALVESIRASGLPVHLEIRRDITGSSPQTGQVAYRVIQEALTNTLRHAGAVATTVSIDREDSQIAIRVHDAGAPVTAPEHAQPGSVRSSAGHGLRGMRERVTYLGGTLAAGPDPEGGFTVSAWLPNDVPA